MKPVILIADDESDSADLLGILLESYLPEAIVKVAHGGPPALQLARVHPPHVAVLDLEMPELDGVGLAGELRRLKRNAPPYLIALSGNVAKLAALNGDNVFDHLMSKPVDLPNLVRVLHARLKPANDPSSSP